MRSQGYQLKDWMVQECGLRHGRLPAQSQGIVPLLQDPVMYAMMH